MQRQRILKVAVALAGACAFANAASASTAQNCLQISERRQVEEQYSNGQGQPAVWLKQAGHPARGQTVFITLRATNICADALKPSVIDFTIPERMTYVLGSAKGHESDVVYSIDGKTYGRFDALAIHEGGGARAARAEDIKSIRWIDRQTLAPNSTRTVKFRAIAS